MVNTSFCFQTSISQKIHYNSHMEIIHTQPFDYHGIERTQEQSGAHRVQPVTQAELSNINKNTQGRIGQILELPSNNGMPSVNPNAEIDLAFRIAAVRLSIQGLKPFNPNS